MSDRRLEEATWVLRGTPGDFMPSEVAQKVLAAADAADDHVRVPVELLRLIRPLVEDAYYYDGLPAEDPDSWSHTLRKIDRLIDTPNSEE